MAEEMPEDWQVPTFREIAEPVTMFGLPPTQTMLPVMLGGGAAAVMVMVSTATGSFRLLISALVVALVTIPAGLFLLRHLFKIDNYWFEHLTTHRFPACRYLGK